MHCGPVSLADQVDCNMKDAECSLVDNLIADKTYLADVSTGCSSPPQGERLQQYVRASYVVYQWCYCIVN